MTFFMTRIRYQQLDAQLDAMLEEWKPMVFEVFPWKTTRTYIVRKTDAIMTLLDEQIVKTQVLFLCSFCPSTVTAIRTIDNHDHCNCQNQETRMSV